MNVPRDSDWLNQTPARLQVGGTSLRPLTSAMLNMRLDHAAAIDTVYGTVQSELIDDLRLIRLNSQAHTDKTTYLSHPELGRVLTPASVEILLERGQRNAQVQVLVSNGLSAEAINQNLREIYPAFLRSCGIHELSVPQAFYIENGRVALINQVGELLQSQAVVIFIGERPGLANSASLSAYYCFKPRMDTVTANWQVLSNIHRNGTHPLEAGNMLGNIMRGFF